jgi:hypothetical protein
MTSIQGGFNPQANIAALRPQAPAVQAQATQAAAPQAAEAPKVPTGPTQTTATTQKALALTSEATQAKLTQLLQNARVAPGLDRPPLQILGQGASMGSALAQALAGHQPPEGAASQAAQTFAGQQQTAASLKTRPKETEDSAWQTNKQSGKRLRREDQEGEFNLMDDSAGQGMGGGQSDSQQNKDRKRQPESWGKPAVKGAAPAPLKRPGQPPKPPGGAPPKPPTSRRQPGGF